MIKNVIKCPSCGMEYHPAEIFVPNSVFGKPDIVKRDTEGHIVECSGTDMDLADRYICDKCNNTFKVSCNIEFNTCVIEEDSRFEEYVAPPKAKFKVDEF